MSSIYEKLVIVSSPSGGGKGTLISMLLDACDDVWLSISATSRKPRVGEVDGVQYYFLSRKKFESKIKENGFLEWACYSDNYYGTPKQSVEEHLRCGQIVILEIEVQGAMEVMEKCKGSHSVFIMPPSMEVLEKRLRGRATDDESAILKRLQTASQEMKKSEIYEKVIVNDDLDVAFLELKEYISKIQNSN